ncbi:MAG: response regulator, partial [Beijerinckiaceae bacterium]|nr:response regulator [Beijerinckiaceae bacterium]
MSASSQPRSLCIIDDDEEYGEFLASFLRSQGMEVALYSSGNAFLDDNNITIYDFFIVDLGLPGIDGVDLIMLIRAQSHAGLVVISGRMGPDAFNSALSAGADMFLNKPVRFDQVLQAIKTVSGRVARGDTGAVHWDLVTSAGEVHCSSGVIVKLTPLELQILKALTIHGLEGCDRKTLGS